ncbi:NAD(P)/FAD-dependent oxidoreductase [Dongia deserti]|uniref:NAD(P)/FAD-dependent oxidoreductase n=1 Tax=Dongia deserti TaxID=2268030 RepID=UPI000E6498D5|nr:FAD-dependent oxidoreductase [Dongia deserti]
MTINIIDPNAPGQAHVDSYWAATGGAEITDATPIAGDMDVDIAIIGGGYTGLSTALHLGRKFGVTSHVLEANRIGWGCSGRNGGFATLGIGKTSMAGWIRRWGEAEARRIFDQSGDAVRLVRRLLTDEGIDAEATPDGNLELAHLPNRMRTLEHDQRMLEAKFGVKSRLIGKAELERNYLISREAHGALLFETGFALHAMKYVRGLARAAQRAGAVLHESSPVQGWARDGKRHVLSTPGGKVRAKQVVIAGNGYTGDRLHPAIDGRLLPALSNIVVTRPLTETERKALNWSTTLPISDTRNLLFYYRQLPDHRILFGARGGIEDTAASRIAHKRWLLGRLTDMFPILKDIETTHFWSGWVCVPFDKSPHVNSIEDGTVHYALGYVGTGVALATYCGLLLTHRLAGDTSLKPSPLLARPLPRFPFPALRRTYQRAMYAYFGLQDRY